MERRIIFVDDEVMSGNPSWGGQIISYATGLGEAKIHVGPTERYQAEFTSSLDFGIFRTVDGAVEYFDRLVQDDDEWKEISGMIIDARMSPGKLKEARNATEETAGFVLIMYLHEMMVKNKKSGMKIYLLTNFGDAITTMKEILSQRKIGSKEPQVAFKPTDKGITLDGSDIEIRFKRKTTTDAPEGVSRFVNDLLVWMK